MEAVTVGLGKMVSVPEGHPGAAARNLPSDRALLYSESWRLALTEYSSWLLRGSLDTVLVGTQSVLEYYDVAQIQVTAMEACSAQRINEWRKQRLCLSNL